MCVPLMHAAHCEDAIIKGFNTVLKATAIKLLMKLGKIPVLYWE